MTAQGPSKFTRDSIPSPSSGFDGKLRCPSLADLVQLECLSGARAAIEINSNGRIGRMFFEHGEIVHALAPGVSGEDAVFEILGWSTGSFADAEAPWPLKRTIVSPWQQLLMRAAQAFDERARGVPSEPSRSASRLVALSSLRPPPLPSSGASPNTLPSARVPGSSVPPLFPSSVPPRSTHEVVRGARVHESGRVLAAEGPVAELVDLAAYLKRLVVLIGQDLGLTQFQELVWDRQTTRITLHAAPGSSFVAIEAPRGRDTSALRERLEA